MANHRPRLGPDGNPAEDVEINPKAVARKIATEEANVKAVEEAAQPWGRIKIIRELEKLRSQERVVINGREVSPSLDLHGVEIPEGEDLSGLDLSNANMHGLKAAGVSFKGSILSKANLHSAVLEGCDLTDVEIEETNLCESCCCGSKVLIRRREQKPGEQPRHISFHANLSGACIEGCGLNVEEKPLTAAERLAATRRHSEGYRIHVSIDEGKVRYVGPELSDVNVTGLLLSCRRKR